MKNTINIVTIISSPHRKGYSATLARKAMNAAKEEGVDVEEIYLLDYNIKYCSGCMNCVSGNKCTLGDELNLLRSKLEKAEGIIISSPTYALMPNAIMMNFIQRIGIYSAYRSSLAGKYIVGISTAGGVGSKKVAKYLTEITDGLFDLGYRSGILGVKVGHDDLKPEDLDQAADLGKKLIQDIITKRKFRFQKLFSKLLSIIVLKPIMKKNLKENGEKEMQGVYEYLKEKGKI
ncbi:MAG: flavodoxin family protein [Candidatus Lokiarchaeota archaeon]|nr:flavodoxin family protein [Candidatus Lokiarchaeota archaeon]MBD3200124.1 flavodoxin family protein [Candidatus Lokiarchaeota archaeon]